MYDAFSSTPDQRRALHRAAREQVDLLARNANTAANRALSAGLDLNHGVDRIPQRELDAVLWKSVHGAPRLRRRPARTRWARSGATAERLVVVASRM